MVICSNCVCTFIYWYNTFIIIIYGLTSFFGNLIVMFIGIQHITCCLKIYIETIPPIAKRKMGMGRFKQYRE